MNPVKPPEKLFQLSPDHNHEKYDSKTVEFICDSDGTLFDSLSRTDIGEVIGHDVAASVAEDVAYEE